MNFWNNYSMSKVETGETNEMNDLIRERDRYEKNYAIDFV